jgi:membrane protein required for colicin V production
MMSEFPINVTDLVILALLLISGLLALSRGFVKEVLSIAGWVAAALAALTWFPLFQPVIERYVDQALIAGGIAFVVIFVAVLTLASLLSSAISRRVRGSEIGVLDRSLGFLFGLARGVFVIALGYLVLVQFLTVEEQPDWLREARAMPAIEYSAAALARLAPEDIGEGLAGIGELGRSGTRSLDATLDSAIKAGRAAEQLQSITRGTDKHGESGYTLGSREDMNRLIQKRTDN